MITLIEAKNFRCLRYIRQPLGPFHVLVGPNASGKTTFLDVIAFLGKLVSDGLEKTIDERTRNFRDLVWGREGDDFELAVEVAIPEKQRALLKVKELSTIRYEVAFGIDDRTKEFGIKTEKVVLKRNPKNEGNHQKELFPYWEGPSPGTIMMDKCNFFQCK
jgi:predicted ATPase